MDMAKGSDEALMAEQEMQLRQPIRDYVSETQREIDSLREDGTNKVVALQNSIDAIKRGRSPTKEEREGRIAASNTEMEKARAVGAKNKDEIAKLISNAESYLKAHLNKGYYLPLRESCEQEKALVKERYGIKVMELNKEHENTLSRLTDHREVEDEKYIHKNRPFDTKVDLDEELQRIKGRRHAALVWQYHLINMLRLSKFTFMETRAQKWENYKYTLNRRTFSLQNNLHIVITLIFTGLCIAAPVIKNVQLLTYNNVLNILQQASPRMFLALGAAGLILLTGTDLSIGRMVGIGITITTIIMHRDISTGAVFGHVFDFTGMPIGLRVVFALVMCIILCTCSTIIGDSFTAEFKMYLFISTMANVLIIFRLVTYATKGVSSGAIEPAILKMIIPKINGFPTTILQAVAAIVIVWFIWNKTTFGKNLYAVGDNSEAATISGISVFGVAMGAFILIGILYRLGSWLECARMVGSGSIAYGQGWEMGAIATCVVGDVSFTNGISEISGVVVGVLIPTVLIYSLTILGINTSLQFVFEGIIIITTATLDCLKYVQKE